MRLLNLLLVVLVLLLCVTSAMSAQACPPGGCVAKTVHAILPPYTHVPALRIQRLPDVSTEVTPGVPLTVTKDGLWYPGKHRVQKYRERKAQAIQRGTRRGKRC